jgi:hypothetical protein
VLIEPKCYTRKCKHYIGVYQPDGTEMTEHNICKAFPKGTRGIPDEIAYGENLHISPFPGDHGIIYEKG